MAMDSTETGSVPAAGGDVILIVDDDERTSRLERFVLEEEGFTVACVGSGEEALETLPTTVPSLILLDIGLPQMDGFMTCQKIRETSQVPIIMVTGEGHDEDKIRGLEMGADDYITKPFSTNELAARVKAVLRRINGSQSYTVSAPTAPAAEHNGKDFEQNGRNGGSATDIGEMSSGKIRDPANENGAPALTKNDENYEGAVKLVVETTGAIKNMVDFVDALRGYPEFHLLRMVSNARRDGMDVWLRLREPSPLRTTLLAAKGVTKVEAVDRADFDPETGAETRVLRVSLN